MGASTFLFALAQSTAGATGTTNGGADPMSKWLIFIGIMAFTLWFLILRPQKKEQQKRDQLLSGLSKGDRVVTAGGIHGIVTNATAKDTVEVEVARNVRLTFNRSSISVIDAKKGGEADGESKSEGKK